MQLTPQEMRSAHFFAGCGGDIHGMKQAGWSPSLAVELKPARCTTLRANHPGLKVVEGPIQNFTLDQYPAEPLLLTFLTFPCDNYTLAANVHGHWKGDQLYLEALREIVLRYPEIVVIENVLGLLKFRRVIETFRCLPLYYTTECILMGEDFTHQKKARVFLILTRQPFAFPDITAYAAPRPGCCLGDYLEYDAPLPPIPPYIYTRLDGERYRDRSIIYDPCRIEPVNLFTNIGRDRSLFLVLDPRAPRGVRPFTVREVANLHGFHHDYQFLGSLNERYDMVVDSVMPLMARAIGLAINDYLASIPALADRPSSLGYRELISPQRKRQQMEEALTILREPTQGDWSSWPREVKKVSLWDTDLSSAA